MSNLYLPRKFAIETLVSILKLTVAAQIGWEIEGGALSCSCFLSDIRIVVNFSNNPHPILADCPITVQSLTLYSVDDIQGIKFTYNPNDPEFYKLELDINRMIYILWYPLNKPAHIQAVLREWLSNSLADQYRKALDHSYRIGPPSHLYETIK